MAGRTDLHFYLGHGRAGLEGIAAGADHCAFHIFGMDVFLHTSSEFGF
jgi:hypothetical protein